MTWVSFQSIRRTEHLPVIQEIYIKVLVAVSSRSLSQQCTLFLTNHYITPRFSIGKTTAMGHCCTLFSRCPFWRNSKRTNLHGPRNIPIVPGILGSKDSFLSTLGRTYSTCPPKFGRFAMKLGRPSWHGTWGACNMPCCIDTFGCTDALIAGILGTVLCASSL